MRIDRRSLVLSATSVLFAGIAGNLGVLPACAESASQIPFLSLISLTLDFMKRSGDTELEFDAINIKIDRILQNQLLLIKAISAMNETLTDIQKLVTDVPSETVVLQQVLSATARVKAIADIVSALQKRPKDSQALGYYRIERDKLYDFSNEMVSAVAATTRPPGLALAAKHALNAVTLLSNFEKNSRKVHDKIGSERMKAIAFNVMSTLQAMTGDEGIRAALPLFREKLKLRQHDLMSLPFVDLLPQGFGSSSMFSPLLEDEFLGPSGANDAAYWSRVRGDLESCLRSPFTEEYIRSERLTNLPTTSAPNPPPYGFINDIRYTTVLKYVKYHLGRYVTYSREVAYTIEMLPKESWVTRSWSKVMQTHTHEPTKTLSSDPERLLAPCIEIADSGNGAPEIFEVFQSYLAAYSNLIVLEARLIALQDSAVIDLKRATHLYDSLG
jgi:arginyl-tRNA--protein-N-Asp/Glu arginylyltransferase